MPGQVKVSDLAEKLRTPARIAAPSSHEASAKLARLLRFPELLRIELERHLGDNVEVVIATQHHVVVHITSQHKQA